MALGIPADERDNQKLFAALRLSEGYIDGYNAEGYIAKGYIDEGYIEDDLWSARIRTFDPNHFIT